MEKLFRPFLMPYWWSAGPVIFVCNLFSRTVIYISVGLHLLMLHAGEKWAAAEYSTSPKGGGGVHMAEREVVVAQAQREVAVYVCVEKWRVQTMHFQVLKWRGLQLQLKIKRPVCLSNDDPSPFVFLLPNNRGVVEAWQMQNTFWLNCAVLPETFHQDIMQ